MKTCLIFLFLVCNLAYAMPNPASVYCERHGGKTEVRGVLTGICLFSDESYCEEWSYFRGACKAGRFFLPEKKTGTNYCLYSLGKKGFIVYLCKAK